MKLSIKLIAAAFIIYLFPHAGITSAATSEAGGAQTGMTLCSRSAGCRRLKAHCTSSTDEPLAEKALSTDTESEIWPERSWSAYRRPEDVGWSSEKLNAARALWDTLQSDAFMVVYKGAALVAWGDVSRRYMCHSVRKSFLSALYGIYVGDGIIDTSRTIGEAGIDDVPPLLPQEKEARIADLLKSRSGVYHPAAYETPGMKKRRPARGSWKPGEFWYYNNWDFNALGTIFKMETGTDLFKAFTDRIARPIGMEDFRPMDTYFHLEREHSIHPAYPFRMSARDMARFGLLYLRGGRWLDGRIIAEEWIRESTRGHSKVPYWNGHGYGFLWWMNEDPSDRKCGMYMALGYGGHMIAVLPSEELVIVNRPNTYVGERTSMEEIYRLIDAVLDARVVTEAQGQVKTAVLVPLEVEEDRYAGFIDRSVPLERYAAEFKFVREETFLETVPYVIGDILGDRILLSLDKAGEGSATSESGGGWDPHGGSSAQGARHRLLLRDSLGQRYYVIPLSREKFLIEDMEVPIVFELDSDGSPVRLTIDASPGWKLFGVRADEVEKR